MKRIAKLIKLSAAVLAGCSMFFTGCEMLQDSLSSEMSEQMTKDTGSASVADSVWYYNGTKTTDMSSTTNNYLRINYGKKVSPKSVTGSFTVTWIDSDSKTWSVKTSLADDPGFLTADETGYNLNLTPAMKYVKSGNAGDGTYSVAVVLSGLVCNEGSQKDRSVAAFSKSITLKPLYTNTEFSFSSKKTTFEIPLNGTVTMDSDAALTYAVSSGSLPSGAAFTLSGVSSAGNSIVFTGSSIESDGDYSVTFTVSGIHPVTSGTAYTKSFTAAFASGVSSTDVLGSNGLYDGTKLNSVFAKISGTNLVVTVKGAAEFKAYSNSCISVFVDNTSKTDATGVLGVNKSWPTVTYSGSDYWPYVVAADSVSEASGSSVDVWSTLAFFGDLSEATSYGKIMPVLTYYDSAVTSELGDISGFTSYFPQASDWYLPAGTDTLTYTIPLSKIRNAVNGDVLKISVIVTHKDGSIADCCPTAAFKAGDEAASASWSAQSITIDMSKALSITVE